MASYTEYETYMKKYKEEYGEQVVVLYQCGKFYEIYDANEGLVNIKELSELLNIQLTKRNKAKIKIDRSNFSMIGFPMQVLPRYINLLTNNQYTCYYV